MNGEQESRRTKPDNQDDYDDNDDRFTLRRHSPSMKIEAGDILG